MRFIDLLFEDQAESEATPVADAPTSMQTYYHVTTRRRLKAIQTIGIEPNHHRRWKNAFGAQLGDRGYIYFMSDFTAAVRWAANMQWHEYQGKVPDPSPYVIVQFHADPAQTESDPHPENGFSYGNTWYRMKGSVPPEAIDRTVPMTQELVQQVVKNGKAVMEGFRHRWNLADCLEELRNKGWQETSVPGEFKNTDYPEFSIDLDIDSPAEGPFAVFARSQKLASLSKVPYPQHLAMRYKSVQ